METEGLAGDKLSGVSGHNEALRSDDQLGNGWLGKLLAEDVANNGARRSAIVSWRLTVCPGLPQ